MYNVFTKEAAGWKDSRTFDADKSFKMPSDTSAINVLASLGDWGGEQAFGAAKSPITAALAGLAAPVVKNPLINLLSKATNQKGSTEALRSMNFRGILQDSNSVRKSQGSVAYLKHLFGNLGPKNPAYGDAAKSVVRRLSHNGVTKRLGSLLRTGTLDPKMAKNILKGISKGGRGGKGSAVVSGITAIVAALTAGNIATKLKD